MSRTTSTAVQGILLSDYGPLEDGTEPSLTPFIDTASAMVDDVVDCAALKDIVLTDARLELIERWLAAHLYAVSDKPYTSKSTEGASASFNGQTATYLEATLYGQTAMRLDSSNCLNAVGAAETKVASGFWLGKPPSEQIDYRDRD